MAEIVTGIAGSQKGARESATAARNTRKGKYKKYGGYAALLAGFLVLLYTFTTWVASEPFRASAPTPVATQNSSSSVVTWDRLEADGSVPVGVWSHELLGKPGCSVRVVHDQRMRRQYRYLTMEWQDYIPGTNPDFSAMRFMASEPGMRQPVYTFDKCR